MKTESKTCISCNFSSLESILPMGQMPLANGLLTKDQLKEPEPTYPQELAFCPQCTLVQITHIVPPEKLFLNYLYFSSYSNTMLDHAKEIACRLIDSRNLDHSSLIVELASNDGYLLQNFVLRGIPVLGIEPAKNIAKVAQDKGIRTISEFFGPQLAHQLIQQKSAADVIIANNVLAHVADLNGFIKGIRLLLKEKGVAVIEVPYLKDLIDRCEFDTIYHEHLCYFSLTALDYLMKRHGLILMDVERIPIHGGSLLLFIAQEDHAQSSKKVLALIKEEKEWGLDRIESYRDFGRKVEKVKKSLRFFLESQKREGKRIAAYGAAAKGTVLLNYFKIGNELLDFVVDRSPYKQGLYMPGVHFPIHPPSRLLEEMPDYTLLLAWNVMNEVLEQQAEYRKRGGKFIIPIPEVRIV